MCIIHLIGFPTNGWASPKAATNSDTKSIKNLFKKHTYPMLLAKHRGILLILTPDSLGI